MKSTKIARINYKNCYIIFISIIAFASIIGNYVQDQFYNKAISIQQQTIDQIVNDDEAVMNYYK